MINGTETPCNSMISLDSNVNIIYSVGELTGRYNLHVWGN